ncbi:MAG TPA: agmatinase, partial [Dehalococcoidia bacterium]|nr:agmatinase [Dehalococcoidia bacterium]
RFAPKSIIEISDYLEFYDMEMDREIHKVGIHTAAPVEPHPASPQKTVEDIYSAASALLQKADFILGIGGEHTVSLGLIQAYRERYEDLTVLHLDAHADLRDEYNGHRYGQATVMRRVHELCPIVQAGIRSMCLEEKNFIEEKGIPLFGDISRLGQTSYIEKIVSRLSEHVYISLDMDILDPGVMPAVGTPEPGGVQWTDLLILLRLVSAKRKVVGADIVELCPQQGPDYCAYMAAVLAYKLIGYCI